MRAALGFVGVHALFALVGMALLFALGFVTRAREAVAALGPAYLCGVAATGPVLILLLVLGMSVRMPHVVVATLALAAGLGAVGLARRGRSEPGPAPPAASPPERWAIRGAIAAVAVFFAWGARAFANLPTLNDDWTIWSYKALALYHFGELESETFAEQGAGPWHAEYPILHPLLESVFFRAMGGVHLQEAHMALWVLFGAFVWTVAWLLRDRGIGLVVALVPAVAVAVAAGAHRSIALGYADVTVACFAAAGVLALGLWVGGGPVRLALLGGVLLTGAANVKSEGLAVAVIALVAAAATTRLARVARWRELGAAAGIAIGGAVPWLAWAAANDLENVDARGIGEVGPGFLADHLGRLSRANGELLEQLASQGLWTWVVPAFLLVAVACAATGIARGEATFYLATAALTIAAFLWVYWTGTREIGVFLGHSAERVVTTVVFVCAAGLGHLAGVLVAVRANGS